MLGHAPIVGFIPTKDFARARSFYVDVLGLRFVRADAFAMVLEANGTTIRVSQVAKFEPYPFTVLGWKVSPIEETVAHLEKRGVLFERFDGLKQEASGIWISPSGSKVAWFKDPDGNLLSLSDHPD
jgi:catechol 2,3-dioxygenase-like lactoylglutathione lyase family enzyme